MHNNLSRFMGISALKTVFKHIENSLRNWRKPLDKEEFTHYVCCQYLETYTIFSKTNFCGRLVFLLKIKFDRKKSCSICFSNSFWFFLRDFSTVMQIIVCSALKSIKPMTIIAAKMGQNGRWIFMKLFALSGLGSS